MTILTEQEIDDISRDWLINIPTGYDLKWAIINSHRAQAAEIKRLEKLDREAATYVESAICMRTHFTGQPPYVGWKGLGLALKEVLDERDKSEFPDSQTP